MKFIEQYEQWIDKTEKSTTNLSDDFRPLAGENIEKCRECVERMLETLNFLKKMIRRLRHLILQTKLCFFSG